MPKAYPKKRGGTKRYPRKKNVGRASKKGGKGATTKLKAMVAKEMANVLRSGAQNERRKLTMEMSVDEYSIFVNQKQANDNSIRIPVTAAIPTQAGVAGGSDIRRRRANKVMLVGVNVRASFSVAEELRVMILAYEPHETVQLALSSVELVTEPSAAMGKVPDTFKTKLTPFRGLGLVSAHGPLMTKKFGATIQLDSVDGSPYECRVATHAGKPMDCLAPSSSSSTARACPQARDHSDSP